MAILMRKDLNEKREQKRLMLLDTSRKSKEMEMESLRKKFEEEGMQVAHIQEDREKQSLISKAKRKLAQQLKAENIERMKRKEDYEREVTECKLNEDAKRIEDMLKKKENILTQRRIEAVQTKRKKDEIINIIEQANLIGSKNVVKLLSNLDDSQKMSKEVSSTCRPASSPNSAHRGRDQIESMKTKMVASRTARDTDHNMAARSPNVPPVTEIRMRSSECSVLENQQQKTVFSRSTRKNQQYSKQAQNLSPSPYSKTMVLWSS